MATLIDFGIAFRRPTLGDEIARAGRIAADNYTRIHGIEPHPLMNIFSLIEVYATIPTLDELSAKTAALDAKIASAKARLALTA